MAASSIGSRCGTKIAAQGMRNSNVLAIAPTATISNIMGTSPCIEPLYKNLFAKSNISGDFVILNPFLVRDLKAAGLWSAALAEEIKRRDGDISEIAAIPAGDPRALPHGVPDRQLLADRGRRAASEVDRPVAVAQPVPAVSRT